MKAHQTLKVPHQTLKAPHGAVSSSSQSSERPIGCGLAVVANAAVSGQEIISSHGECFSKFSQPRELAVKKQVLALLAFGLVSLAVFFNGGQSENLATYRVDKQSSLRCLIDYGA
jgi:hypothetical protein